MVALYQGKLPHQIIISAAMHVSLTVCEKKKSYTSLYYTKL